MKYYTDQQIESLLQEVESKFAEHLAKTEEEVLAKSEKTEGEVAEESQPEEAKELAKAEDKDMDAKDMDKCGDMEVKKAEDKEDDKEEDDEEEMEKMYRSMDEAEKQAHHRALKKAMAAGKMHKSEEDVEQDETSLLKSEIDSLRQANEELKKSSEETKKSFDELVVALNKRFVKTAPKQKAITNLVGLEKGETTQEEKPLAKSEIDQILTKKSADPTLLKSDRAAINDYYLKNGGLDKIRHLLKEG